MFPFFLRLFFSRFVYFKSFAFGVLCQNLPNGPEIDPAFSSIFMFIVIFVLLKTWHLPHVYIMVVFFFGTSFPLGFILNTLKKRYVFWMVLGFATAPAILLHHLNLRTVFAVISHTSAFRCMYRHCQALTYVMIIGLRLHRLPGSIFLQAFQQLSIVPVWAKTFRLPLDTARSRKLAFEVAHKLSVQRNMKLSHRSTTEVCNVT